MGRSKKSKGVVTSRVQKAHALDDVPFVPCDDCRNDKQETVLEFAAQIPHNAVVCSFWLPAPTADRCGLCAAKPPAATFALADLVDEDLPRESVTVEKAMGIMHGMMLEMCDRTIRELLEGGATPASASVEAVRRMSRETSDKYKKVRARVAPKTLYAKLKRMTAELGAMPDQLLCKSKIHVECVDGTAAFQLTLMGLSLSKAK